VDNKNLLIIGAGAAFIFILKDKLFNNVLEPAMENIDAGMDNTADFYVRKQMAWNEFWNNSDTMQERYDNFMIYLGVGDG